MRNKLFRHIGWKIGGIILALLLWFHLTTQQSYHQELTLDIEYVGVPEGMALGNNSQKTALVELTADGKQLLKILYFEEVKLVIDLSDFTTTGEYSLEFTEDNLVIPSGHNGVMIKFIAPLACEFELVPEQFHSPQS